MNYELVQQLACIWLVRQPMTGAIYLYAYFKLNIFIDLMTGQDTLHSHQGPCCIF